MIAYAVVGGVAAVVGLAAALQVVCAPEELQGPTEPADTSAFEPSVTAVDAGLELLAETAVEVGLELLGALAG